MTSLTITSHHWLLVFPDGPRYTASGRTAEKTPFRTILPLSRAYPLPRYVTYHQTIYSGSITPAFQLTLHNIKQITGTFNTTYTDLNVKN
jgi:hypothetical protein